MNSIEFGKACQPLNTVYRDMFGTVPCPADYACNRDDFLVALKKAIEHNQPMEKYVPLIAKHTDSTKIY